jgi:alcohol dehydrogenase
MMATAAMGAVAFSRGLGAMHSISHPIGAQFNTHHGMTNAVVMPYVLRANKPAIKPVMERLGLYCGIDGGVDGMIDHVLQMRSEFGVPHTLVELGVDQSSTEQIVAAAIVDPTAASNPVPLTTELATAIFTAACNGRIEDLNVS